MALFSTAVDTCLYSFSIRRFLFRSTVAPLRCCQPKKLGASLAKLYSPKCLELDFSHLSHTGWIAHRPSAQREAISSWLLTPPFAISATKKLQATLRKGLLRG